MRRQIITEHSLTRYQAHQRQASQRRGLHGAPDLATTPRCPGDVVVRLILSISPLLQTLMMLLE
jgi:hypothetical protein